MKFAEQVTTGQFIPPKLLVTLPLPGGPATVMVRVNIGLKVAMTDCAPLITTVQLLVPVQPPPLHPANAKPLAGTADSVTLVPLLKLAVQLAGQLIPPRLLVTVPEPATLTVSEKVTTPNVAVTELAAFMVTMQVAVPEQAPLHPAKMVPAAGVAVSVTTVPLLKFTVQVPGQFMPPGLLVTVPPPATATVNENT